MTKLATEITLFGTSISPGIAIGKPYFFCWKDDKVPEFVVSEEDIEQEIERYHEALRLCRDEIRVLQKKLKDELIQEGAEIIEAQLHITQDPLFTHTMEEEIRSSKKNAEAAFKKVIQRYQDRFHSLKEPFFRERFKDIQDISRRIILYLRRSIRFSLAEIPKDSIIVSSELSAIEAAEAKKGKVLALLTGKGSSTSHAAIVAKARGIPFIANIDLKALHADVDFLIVDARKGVVIVNPTDETINSYKALSSDISLRFSKLIEKPTLSAETFDGYKIRLSANLEMASDVDSLHEHGPLGVGLFRSEYIFLPKKEFPTEDRQFEIYRDIVQKMRGLPIVIRTFDVGGDKSIQDLPTLQKGNPFLGCRALRFLLREREIFKAQLRAILRAALYGEVSILFPMVSSLNEIKEAKLLIEETKKELDLKGVQRADRVRIGCMIEVPSAAIIADLIAKECDFLSIGTNDLVQYSLAVDRANHDMQGYYTPTHPGVIRLIKLVVAEANLKGIPVSVCGEIAADPRFTSLLIGLGIQELSLASRYIPVIKNAIRSTSIIDACKLAEKALSLSTAEEISDLLTEEYKNSVPEDLHFISSSM
ncbi:phosphoenolpyruvate--protein phosphotransferase [Estrella lausannensis]|uniref:Phosphoenolpyruvate-protein phosphotransferase n=1 Tax=Estrella lausannensis TaxID=483423 RepID=A0A0H5DS33_9BACT|nr:phosphoenolpyruvate--protein phosphotransferase [Estrella lausannensis]CRX38539.1 Phosphoenolpyruvate-protein phosphotransferase [Estrella lausannensis]